MEFHLRLPDADRERLGCPDLLILDPLSVTVREVAALQKGVVIDEDLTIQYDNMSYWSKGLEQSEPTAAWVLVWLALRHSGIMVSLAELESLPIHQVKLDFVGDEVEPEDPDASPGKDEETPNSDEPLVPSDPTE